MTTIEGELGHLLRNVEGEDLRDCSCAAVQMKDQVKEKIFELRKLNTNIKIQNQYGELCK